MEPHLSLNQHLDYLQSKDRLSINSLDLYRQSIKACNISSVNPDAINSLWAHLLEQLKAGVSPTYVRKAQTVVKGVLRFNGIAVLPNKEQSLLNFELAALNSKAVSEYTEQDVKLLLKL